jgi:hypothetical protein
MIVALKPLIEVFYGGQISDLYRLDLNLHESEVKLCVCNKCNWFIAFIYLGCFYMINRLVLLTVLGRNIFCSLPCRNVCSRAGDERSYCC